MFGTYFPLPVRKSCAQSLYFCLIPFEEANNSICNQPCILATQHVSKIVEYNNITQLKVYLSVTIYLQVIFLDTFIKYVQNQGVG